MKLLLLSAITLFLFTSCVTETATEILTGDTPKYTDISAADAMAMYDDFTAIYDVSPKYDNGHLPKSTNAGSVDGLTALAASLDKSGTYLVYCHADAPAIAGAETLIAAGIENVYRLEGNYGSWDALYYVDIAAAEAKRKLDAGEFMAIYDVSPHHADNHIPGAIDAYGTLATLITDQPAEKEYLVYCHADEPAIAGAKLMEEAGFHSTYRLEGNFGAWTDAGYPVE